MADEIKTVDPKGLSIDDIRGLKIGEIVELVKNGKIPSPLIVHIPLDVAMNAKPFDWSGDFVGVVDASDALAKIKIQFRSNEQSSALIPFTRGFSHKNPYDKVFLTCDAQPGKWIDLIFTAYSTELFQIIDNRSEIVQTQELSGIKANTRNLNADTGTQVQKSANASNNTVIIHTVTAGKTLYLTAAHILAVTGNASFGDIFVRNEADAEQYKLLTADSDGGVSGNNSASLPYAKPIKIPAGYDICVRSSAGNSVHASISGWEE